MIDTDLVLLDKIISYGEGEEGAAESALISPTELMRHVGRQHKKRDMSLHCSSSERSIQLDMLGAVKNAGLRLVV